MSQAPSDATVTIEGVPARLLLESQDHQHDLIRELQLIDMGERFNLTPRDVSRRLASLISSVLARYADVRTTSREQALRSLDRGDERFALVLPVRPGMGEALREWLGLVEEADRFCDAGTLLTLGARHEVRELRRWYVEEIVSQLEQTAATAGGED